MDRFVYSNNKGVVEEEGFDDSTSIINNEIVTSAGTPHQGSSPPGEGADGVPDSVEVDNEEGEVEITFSRMAPLKTHFSSMIQVINY